MRLRTPFTVIPHMRARTAIDSFPALFNQRLLIGVLQERLKVESEGVGAIALG